jgi:hypothetical protein
MAVDAGPSKKWIQGAIKHPGSFTRQAKAAGKGVHEYAEEKKHAGGKTGRRARLALILGGMSHEKKESKKEERTEHRTGREARD